MLFDLSLLGICNSKDSGMIGINSSAVSHLIFHLNFHLVFQLVFHLVFHLMRPPAATKLV